MKVGRKEKGRKESVEGNWEVRKEGVKMGREV